VRRLSELEKVEIWDRFEAGESQRSIRRRLGRSSLSIRTHLLGSGFRRPVPGPVWLALRLSLTEWEEISRGLAAGESMRVSQPGWGGLRRRSRGRWLVTAAGLSIGLRELIGRLGIGPGVPNRPSWR